jgi:hypothetical protein
MIYHQVLIYQDVVLTRREKNSIEIVLFFFMAYNFCLGGGLISPNFSFYMCIYIFLRTSRKNVSNFLQRLRLDLSIYRHWFRKFAYIIRFYFIFYSFNLIISFPLMILRFNSVSNSMDNPFDLEQKNKIKEKHNHGFDFFFFMQ